MIYIHKDVIYPDLKYIDSNITSIDKSRLLESMQNLGTLSNKLVNIIIQWSKNI